MWRLLAWLVCLPSLAAANGVYAAGDVVQLYANKVGPFANPNEVYAFFSLPYCQPEDMEIRREDLGPLLKGDRPYKTLYDIRFRESRKWASLCKMHLSDGDVSKFRQAIVDDYYFEMMLDELPIWGYVGELETKSVNLNRQFAPWRFALDDLPASLLSVYITNDGYGCRRGRACRRLALVSSSHLGGRGLV